MLIALALMAAAPDFDAIRFFTGCTHGEGQLKIVLHARERVDVRGVGRIEPDGSLVLDQSVVRPRACRVLRTRPPHRPHPAHGSGGGTEERGDLGVVPVLAEEGPAAGLAASPSARWAAASSARTSRRCG